MEWWAIWLLFFGIFFGCGRMCGWRRHDREERLERMRNRHHHRHRLDRRDTDVYLGSGSYKRGDEEAEPAIAEKRRPQGSRLERLQRDFVEGRISMDEYERRLDTLEIL